MKSLDNKHRRNKIVQYINQNGKATINELAGIFDVSGETIRKDVNYLYDKALIHKSHGIVLSASAYLENAFMRKAAKNLQKKVEIARLAETMISPQSVIYLDASSTVMELAKKLHSHQNLTIITNSLSSTQVLVESDNHVLLTGGKLRHKSFGFIGQWAERAIKQVRFDIAFMGCDGFHNDGPAIRSYQELDSKKLAMSQARKCVLLADSEKIDIDGLYSFAGFDDFDLMITDRVLTNDEKLKFPKNFPIISPKDE